jgi:glycerophosphoryl diester phosphodiesterase
MDLLVGLLILLLPAVFFYFLISPNQKRTFPFARSYAHRGLHGGAIPENSLLAFKRASDEGVGVELDVQLTKDDKLVVFHDETLLRMCGVDVHVRDLTYDELKNFSLAGTDQKIPLFKEVLDILGGVPLLCEIKKRDENTDTKICHIVAHEIDEYKGNFLIESFNPLILRWFKKNRPDIIRGQLSQNFLKNKGDISGVSAFLMTHLLVNVISRPDFIAYRHTDSSLGLTLFRRLFPAPLLGWTAKGDTEREALFSRFDGEIFELLDG